MNKSTREQICCRRGNVVFHINEVVSVVGGRGIIAGSRGPCDDPDDNTQDEKSECNPANDLAALISLALLIGVSIPTSSGIRISVHHFKDIKY
jgi:hypothetical protein